MITNYNQVRRAIDFFLALFFFLFLHFNPWNSLGCFSYSLIPLSLSLSLSDSLTHSLTHSLSLSLSLLLLLSLSFSLQIFCAIFRTQWLKNLLYNVDASIFLKSASHHIYKSNLIFINEIISSHQTLLGKIVYLTLVERLFFGLFCTILQISG